MSSRKSKKFRLKEEVTEKFILNPVSPKDEFLYRWLEDALIDPGLEFTNIAKKYLRLRLFDEEES